MVPCPSCKSPDDVRMHGFRDSDDYVARRVTALTNDYYILSCRLRCYSCKDAGAKARDIAKKAAEAKGLRCVDVEPEDEDEDDLDVDRLSTQYNFMAYNSVGLGLLPYSLGMCFPAYLTYRGAVDLTVIDMLRLLTTAGVRPERFAAVLLELASKQHTKLAIRREEQLRIDRQLNRSRDGEPLSEFGDQLKYAGLVPTGRYFASVLKAYSRTTRAHMDAEVRTAAASHHASHHRCLSPPHRRHFTHHCRRVP